MDVSIVHKTIQDDNIVYPYLETLGMREWLHPELICIGLPDVQATGVLQHLVALVTKKGKDLNKIREIEWEGSRLRCLWLPLTYRFYVFPAEKIEWFTGILKRKYDFNLRLD